MDNYNGDIYEGGCAHWECTSVETGYWISNERDPSIWIINIFGTHKHHEKGEKEEIQEEEDQAHDSHGSWSCPIGEDDKEGANPTSACRQMK